VEIEPVLRRFWGDVWPASTLVEVTRLFDPRHLIEMECVALIGP
jgi:enamine deaminase RidA (YjgF/YER057c/UK114 family)